MAYPRSAEPADEGARSARTGRDLQDAFVRLVAEGSFDSVSIVEICREAKVNRTTFYLHFKDKYEILERCLLDLLAIPEEAVERHSGLPLPDMVFGLMKIVAMNCSEHQAFFLKILEDGKYPAFYNLFSMTLLGGVSELVAGLDGQMQRQGRRLDGNCSVFVSSAFFGSLMHWVKKGRREGLDAYCRSITKYSLAAMGVACPW